MVFQVQADDGSLMDARFEVDENSIIFHSRSGAAPGRDGRNADYSPALRLLLERLADAGVTVDKACVDSSRVQSIAVAARTILDERDAGLPPSEQFSRMASRMQALFTFRGPSPSVKVSDFSPAVISRRLGRG